MIVKSATLDCYNSFTYNACASVDFCLMAL